MVVSLIATYYLTYSVLCVCAAAAAACFPSLPSLTPWKFSEFLSSSGTVYHLKFQLPFECIYVCVCIGIECHVTDKRTNDCPKVENTSTFSLSLSVSKKKLKAYAAASGTTTPFTVQIPPHTKSCNHAHNVIKYNTRTISMKFSHTSAVGSLEFATRIFGLSSWATQ